MESLFLDHELSDLEKICQKIVENHRPLVRACDIDSLIALVLKEAPGTDEMSVREALVTEFEAIAFRAWDEDA